MKLNHIDLQVYDVTRTAAFFERYFGFHVQSNPSSAALLVLTDEAGFVLVLQRAKEPTEKYPEGFHVGFLLDDVDSVRAMHARATADGTPVSDVIVNGRGTMVYLTAPEGYHVEVSCQKRRFERRSPPAA
jgi:catechol 2,3-dioxygenase-like lactoylglutathione lyase family enzyme